MSLVIVSLPAPEPPTICYISMFVSEVHGRKGDLVLVDFPIGLNCRERQWIPAKLTKPV